MEKMVVGDIQFHQDADRSFSDAIWTLKEMKISEQAAWAAFFKLDYELRMLKDSLCQDCLFAWEKREDRLNGKKVHGANKHTDRTSGKQVRTRRHGKKG